MQTVTIKNLSALRKFAVEFANSLRGGEIVGLVGELGAGKTAFVQALAEALGVGEQVKSPTFILMQLFKTGSEASKRGVGRLCHVDAYRLKDHAELEAIGFRDFAGDPRTVTLVEWADRVPEIHDLPGYKEVTIEFEPGGDGRVFRLEKA